MSINNDHNTSLVNLSIPKEVTQPIVAAKIQEAVLAALGGSDKIVASVVNALCNRKVDQHGNTPRYDSDAKSTWIDYHVTTIIQKNIEEEIKKQLIEQSENIKQELIKQLQSKKGSHAVAAAIIDGLGETFKSNWNSKIEIKFTPR